MSRRLLGDTTIAAVQTTVKVNRVVGVLHNNGKGYCFQPTPPPEKKWLYKQLLESVRSGISPQLNLGNSTLGQATSKMWLQLNIAHRRAQDIAEEYHLKEKFEVLVKQMAAAVVAAKDFIAHKQYYQLDRIIDKGLLSLEEKIRTSRENQLLTEGRSSSLLPPTTSMNADKGSMKNCTMIMLKRAPCMSDSNRAKHINKPTSAMSDKS
uniref:Uncharacterized protein n=1 Tax=Anopheles funestus TaxID=62324 RepID=A0A4Y0BK30_ANOFN